MNHNEEPHTSIERPKVSFWRKLGGGSLTISLIVHGALLAVGVFLVVQTIKPTPPPPVDFIAQGGGGSPKSASQEKKRTNVIKNQAARVAAKDAMSTFTLPEPVPMDSMKNLSSLADNSGPVGMGGSGSGGGQGNGTGKGVGDGMGVGLGTGASVNPFGSVDPNSTALIGVLYDFKQTPQRKATGMTPALMGEKLASFMSSGWNERTLAPYYQAPQKLYQRRIYLPSMNADLGPTAFRCQAEVEPKMWCVVYRGTVTAPVTGNFHFVGGGDDFLAVRFDRKTVFDFGCYSATVGQPISPIIGRMGTKDPVAQAFLGKRHPMKLPITQYPYPTTPSQNSYGGFGKGPVFSVTAGRTYQIEILFGEIPGGMMNAQLMIEQEGVNYTKDANGSPILPLFRVDDSNPVAKPGEAAAPFDKNGPVWHIVKPTGGLLEI